LSPEQIAGARADWIKHGLDPAAFDKATGAKPAQREGDFMSNRDPTPPSNTVTLNRDASYGGNLQLSERQADDLANELIKHGVDPDLVAAAMSAEGLVEVEDMRSEEEQRFDAAFASGNPGDYAINLAGVAHADADFAALHEIGQAALSAMQFPPAVGAGVYEWAIADGRTFQNLSPSQREDWLRQQDRDLERVVGIGNVEKAKANATELLKAFAKAKPDAAKMFAEYGAWQSARVVAMLSRQKERNETRLALADRRRASTPS
jgi:hypothetical protein